MINVVYQSYRYQARGLLADRHEQSVAPWPPSLLAQMQITLLSSGLLGSYGWTSEVISNLWVNIKPTYMQSWSCDSSLSVTSVQSLWDTARKTLMGCLWPLPQPVYKYKHEAPYRPFRVLTVDTWSSRPRRKALGMGPQVERGHMYQSAPRTEE